MSETPDELAPLPEEGPASLSGVKRRLNIADTDHEDDTELEDTVDAVNAVIRGDEETGLDALPIVERFRGKEEWSQRVVLGANMLCARLWRRKGTPGGVEVFGDGGFAFVRRSDPDVALLLQIGDEAKPAVG